METRQVIGILLLIGLAVGGYFFYTMYLKCSPKCEGKDCGDDGCEGSCGTCEDGKECSDGVCMCVPNCDGDVCGSGGCEDNPNACGTCEGDQEECQDGKCVCVPSCEGKACGEDGCGNPNACGTCEGEQEVCQDGKCVCVPSCEGKVCGEDGCGNQMHVVHVKGNKRSAIKVSAYVYLIVIIRNAVQTQSVMYHVVLALKDSSVTILNVLVVYRKGETVLLMKIVAQNTQVLDVLTISVQDAQVEQQGLIVNIQILVHVLGTVQHNMMGPVCAIQII